MHKIALTIPGPGGDVTVNNPTGFTDVNSLVSGILKLGIYIAFVLAMSWLAWGVFQYIFSGGNKENLARARARITWAIIGLIIVLLAWAISRYVGEVFQPNNTINVTPVSPP